MPIWKCPLNMDNPFDISKHDQFKNSFKKKKKTRSVYSSQRPIKLWNCFLCLLAVIMFLTSLVMILYAGQEVTKKQHCVAGCYAASKCDIGWECVAILLRVLGARVDDSRIHERSWDQFSKRFSGGLSLVIVSLHSTPPNSNHKKAKKSYLAFYILIIAIEVP